VEIKPAETHDRIAIITGTSAGLGESVARQLLEGGWSVVGIARRPSPVAHERYRHIACDLATVVADPAPLESRLAEGLRGSAASLAREWDDPASAAASPRDAAILSYEPGVVDADMQRYARSRSPAEFPWVGIFLDFAARGIAVPPDRPARDIVAFLESDRQPSFAEARLRA
jgi:hypothetical protein